MKYTARQAPLGFVNVTISDIVETDFTNYILVADNGEGEALTYTFYLIRGQLDLLFIIIRCQIWNRNWRPCLSKHLCHQTTSKNLNPYFVHLLPTYKDYQEMLFFVCPYRVCLLLYQLKIRIPRLYVYTHVLKIPFASS